MTKSNDARSLGDKAEGHLGRLERLAKNLTEEWDDSYGADVSWAVVTIREQRRGLLSYACEDTPLNDILKATCARHERKIREQRARIAQLESHVKAERLRSRLMGICEGFDAGASVEAKEQEKEIAEQAVEVKRLQEALTQIEKRARAIHPKTGDAHFIIEIASGALEEVRCSGGEIEAEG